MTNRTDILDFLIRNKNFLKKKYHITKIGLFGSFARGEEKEDSDIDIIVEFEDGTENLFEIKQDLKDYLRKKFNLNIDICRERYIKPHFKKEILNETIYA